MIITLKLEGITGQTTLSHAADEMEVLNFSHGLSLPIVPGAHNTERTAGKSQWQDLSFSRVVDNASTPLMKACATGSEIPSATLTIARTQGDEVMNFLVYDLTKVYVSSYSIGGNSGGGDLPIESFTLVYATVDITYFQQNADGTLKGNVPLKYDLQANKTAA